MIPPHLLHGVAAPEVRPGAGRDYRSIRVLLLLFEVDLLVGVLHDAGANLRGSFACLGHCIGVKRLLRAGGALRAVVALVATAQAGVAQGAVAAAVARELVENVADLRGLLIDVRLPWVAEVLAVELGARQDGWQGADLERRGGMVSRHFLRGVSPLGVAGNGDSEDGETQDQAAVRNFHAAVFSRSF